MKPHASDDGSSLGGDDVLRRRAIEPPANAASERGRGRAQVLEIFGYRPRRRRRTPHQYRVIELRGELVPAADDVLELATELHRLQLHSYLNASTGLSRAARMLGMIVARKETVMEKTAITVRSMPRVTKGIDDTK